jgi:hypothetical protein
MNIHSDRSDIIVKAHQGWKKSPFLPDVLKTIKNICFSFNPYPIILSI